MLLGGLRAESPISLTNPSNFPQQRQILTGACGDAEVLLGGRLRMHRLNPTQAVRERRKARWSNRTLMLESRQAFLF